MKQILQNLKSGSTELVDVPCPQVKPGHLLIKTVSSVVSAGTEKMLVEFGKANLIEKARKQPEKVKQVLDKIKTDGIVPTLEAVKTKLDQPLPLGYSNAGEVIAVGKGVEGFSIGDRVVSNGNHAQVVLVPKNLCAKIPDNVNYDSAAFTVIASIGLQGIRLANPSLGESFVVIGLGLIGLLTVQLLKAHGCRVLGTDFDQKRLELARKFGAEVVDLSKGEDPIAAAYSFSRGRGVDGVLITASTQSSEPIHQAALMCRKRGRIVLIGVTGLELSRSDFYEKELTFQVSCSYGPGRYDPLYEEKGQDYPVGFVRWTEQRNFEAILDMMSDGKLDVEPLITHRFPIQDAVKAYELLSQGGSSIGIVLNYPYESNENLLKKRVNLSNKQLNGVVDNGLPNVGVIGAGNYTNQVLLPVLKRNNVRLHTIASSGGVNGVHVGKRHGFEYTTTNTLEIFNNQDIDTVIITTRHNTHATFVKEAILAGKHVFVEKPLCINKEELEELEKLKIHENQVFMVGFNRRFAPHIIKMKQLLSTINEPKTMIMTVNAGMIPEDHWTQDPEIGGGRIIGEGCHFIDLLRYLVGHPIVSIQSAMIGRSAAIKIREDKMSFTLLFADGSMGTVHYFANGHKSFPKERLEVFVAGKVLSLDNFRKLIGYGWPNFKKMRLWSQDKGHAGGLKAFIEAVRSGGGHPIPLNEIFEVTRASFEVVEKAKAEER